MRIILKYFRYTLKYKISKNNSKFENMILADKHSLKNPNIYAYIKCSQDSAFSAKLHKFLSSLGSLDGGVFPVRKRP